MAAKVDLSSPVETHHGQSAASSSVSVSNPKVSMFGAKSGFVIPKNKLSGSLVPIFRAGSKVDVGNNVKEESTKQVQRKTKWGADPTQDAAVRKGRALAYQTRVEQITQQLKAGILEIGDDQASQSPKQDSGQQLTTDHIDQKAKTFDLLELEKREIIGEILHLNPSYKAPSDYKPLLKEGKVPIPVKAYPGYNFIGLLLGPESNTQKRLEEETGVKIRVYGTKTNTKEKWEITQSDINEAHTAYEELYVNVTADTYEKVDAAVSLIELLVTPVSGNTALSSNPVSSSGDDRSTNHQSQDASSDEMTMTIDVNQVVPQPMLVSTSSSQLQFQQQYSTPWFSTGLSNPPLQPATGFPPLLTPNNPMQFAPHGGPQYLRPTSLNFTPRTLSPLVSRPQLPLQPAQQPHPHQGIPPQHQALHPAYSGMSGQPNSNRPASFPASQPMLVGPMAPSRPSPPMNQPPRSFSLPFGITPTSGNSFGWSSSSPVVPSLQRPNMMQMSAQHFNQQGRPQQNLLPPQPNMHNNIGRPLAGNFAPANFPTQPTIRPTFTPIPPQIGIVSMQSPVPSSPGAQLQTPVPPPASIPSSMLSSAPRLPAASTSPVPISQAPVSQPGLGMSTSRSAQATAAPSQSVVPVMAPPSTSLPSVTPGLGQTPLQTPRPLPSVTPGLGQIPLQAPRPPAPTGSTAGNMPSLSSIKPTSGSAVGISSVPAPKPLRPSSGDFTFQPLRGQVSESPSTPRPNTVSQNISPTPLAAPQAPSFRPALQNPTPTMGTQSVPLPLAVNQQRPAGGAVPALPTPIPFSANPTQTPRLPTATPTPFPTNVIALRTPPPFPPQSSNSAAPTSQFIQTGPSRPMPPATQIGPASFSPGPRAPTLTTTVPARPLNFLHPHQNQVPPASRAGGAMIPTLQMASNQLGAMPSSAGGSQFYDPFSPTSISSTPQQRGEPQKVQKQETDAEYEDLMASVGVK